MILVTYATFEQMHGLKSSRQELVEKLCRYSQESVISLCSFISILLKLWDPGNYDLVRYDHLISCAFDDLRGSWYKLAARLSEPVFVFHRRQLLLLIKLAAVHCPKVGVDAWKMPPGYFGTILLMANDQFHYDLWPEAGPDQLDQVKRLFAEFIPVAEGAGFRAEYKLVRSRLMLKYADRLRNNADFIDIAGEFQRARGMSLADYETLCFGLFAKCATLSLSNLQRVALAFTFVERNFHEMAIPKESTVLFLDEMRTTPESLSTRISKRDYGSNDFTELRRRPLISISNGDLPVDILFIVEKFESGPYLVINVISMNIG